MEFGDILWPAQIVAGTPLIVTWGLRFTIKVCAAVVKVPQTFVRESVTE